MWAELACLGATALLGVVAVARGVRPIRSAHAYRDVARRRGLEVDTRGLTLHGDVGEHHVWVGEVMIGHGVHRTREVYASVRFARPLGLGLHARRRGIAGRIRRGRRPVVLSHPDLDRRIAVEADDVGIAARLFEGAVPAALRDLTQRWPDILLTDDSVRAKLGVAERRSDVVEQLLDALLGVAETLGRARKALPPLTEVGPWLTAAENLGLSLEPWLPGLTGTVDGYRVIAVANRNADGVGIRVRVRRTNPRMYGLTLRLQGSVEEGAAAAGQDIVVGDADFDPIYVVQAWDPDDARRLLDKKVRVALLALASSGEVDVDDSHLSVQFHLHGPPEDAILAAVSAAAALDQADSGRSNDASASP